MESKNYDGLAPIVLFVYNRPLHTRRTVQALLKNGLASESELFIYSDAPRDADSVDSVREVREYVNSISQFKRTEIIERRENWGLANSIMDGVTSVIERYGKVIVLEDDILTSPYFLEYMNNALNYYKKEKRVWHVSGWNYPIETDGLGEAFVWRVMNCWGWATWADRWEYFERDASSLCMKFSDKQKFDFDLCGTRVFWPQVEENLKGKIDTWAIFWYATIFKGGGLCLNPAVSFTENIGLDGSGVHCKLEHKKHAGELAFRSIASFPGLIEENGLAVERVKMFYRKQRKNVPVRALNKIFRIMFGRSLL